MCGYTYEELKARHLDPEQPTIEDGDEIVSMLIPIFGPLPEDKVQWPRFTCRHLTEEGNCGNYENRPNMCRNYPYGSACQQAHCTAEFEEYEDGEPEPEKLELDCRYR